MNCASHNIYNYICKIKVYVFYILYSCHYSSIGSTNKFTYCANDMDVAYVQTVLTGESSRDSFTTKLATWRSGRNLPNHRVCFSCHRARVAFQCLAQERFSCRRPLHQWPTCFSWRGLAHQLLPRISWHSLPHHRQACVRCHSHDHHHRACAC